MNLRRSISAFEITLDFEGSKVYTVVPMCMVTLPLCAVSAWYLLSALSCIGCKGTSSWRPSLPWRWDRVCWPGGWTATSRWRTWRDSTRNCEAGRWSAWSACGCWAWCCWWSPPCRTPHTCNPSGPAKAMQTCLSHARSAETTSMLLLLRFEKREHLCNRPLPAYTPSRYMWRSTCRMVPHRYVLSMDLSPRLTYASSA